ncbi:MAG: Flp family type IVb pilin [Acidimicrobiia bacterium]
MKPTTNLASHGASMGWESSALGRHLLGFRRRNTPRDQRHRPEERGASMVEYALLVVLIAIVALIAVVAVGGELSQQYDLIARELTDAGS